MVIGWQPSSVRLQSILKLTLLCAFWNCDDLNGYMLLHLQSCFQWDWNNRNRRHTHLSILSLCRQIWTKIFLPFKLLFIVYGARQKLVFNPNLSYLALKSAQLKNYWLVTQNYFFNVLKIFRGWKTDIALIFLRLLHDHVFCSLFVLWKIIWNKNYGLNCLLSMKTSQTVKNSIKICTFVD